jgi:hypothetical protein
VIEHRTHPLSREQMLAEVSELCAKLALAGIERASVSFGWDSNIPIDEMWIDKQVAVSELASYLCKAEVTGAIQIGKSDVFIKSEEIEFVLCHESDLHVRGTHSLVAEIQRRWFNLGYEPYPIETRV